MWLTYSPVTLTLHCNLLSVDKEYQGRGILHEATSICKKIMRQVQAKRLTFRARAAKAFERIGFKNSGYVLMEMENVETI